MTAPRSAAEQDSTPLPLVGVIACNRTVGAEGAQAVMNRYVAGAARHTPALTVLLPSLPDVQDIAAIVPRLDGIVLTGSPSNVAPACYGDAAPGAGPFDADRDATMLALVEAAGRAGVPMLGICRGFQELNVALGGTLRRDLGAADRALSHHAPEGVSFAAMFDHRHPVALTPGSEFARLVGAETITVNSVHFQGVDTPAPGIEVLARAPDGIVEAFAARVGRAELLAVQWHPEWDADRSAASAAVFGLFGRMIARAGGIAANGLSAPWPAPDPAVPHPDAAGRSGERVTAGA